MTLPIIREIVMIERVDKKSNYAWVEKKNNFIFIVSVQTQGKLWLSD